MKFRGAYWFLSNMSNARIVSKEGIIYPTSEHAFQACKTTNLEERRWIASLPDGFKAKKAGRKVTLRPDWNDIRIEVMRRIIRAKFKQNLHLKMKLLSTGEEHLQEDNTWHDTFWGVCNGEGENHLGRILMKTRDMIREDKL